MAEQRKPEEGRSKKDDEQESERDDYAPAVLTEGPKKYRFDDWASI